MLVIYTYAIFHESNIGRWGQGVVFLPPPFLPFSLPISPPFSTLPTFSILLPSFLRSPSLFLPPTLLHPLIHRVILISLPVLINYHICQSHCQPTQLAAVFALLTGNNNRTIYLYCLVDSRNPWSTATCTVSAPLTAQVGEMISSLCKSRTQFSFQMIILVLNGDLTIVFLCLLYEPRHEKTCLMPYANNKGADQPAHSHSLISTFVVHFLDSIVPVLAKPEISRL